MDSKKLGAIKKELESLRDELNGRAERTHKHIHGRETPVSADFHDQSVEMESQQLVIQLDEEARDELRQIEHALERVQDGTYGMCASCGKQIVQERLEAIPFAALCINCAD